MADNQLKPSLFRENALKSLNVVSDIQTSLKVVDTRCGIYILSGLLALAALGIWGWFGRVAIEIPAQGLIVPVRQLELAEKIYQDNRKDRDISLRSAKEMLDKKQQLFNKHYLTMDELDHARQEYFRAKESLVNTPRLNNERPGNLFSDHGNDADSSLLALVFVSHTEGKKIAVNMPALVLPTILSAYEYGYIKGKVISVSEYPASKESVYAYLGNMSLVEEYFAGGVPFVLKIELQHNAHTASKLSWTTREGSPFAVSAGSGITAKIINHEYRPVDLLIKQRRAG